MGIQHPYNPRSRGFEEFFGLPMSHDYGCTNVDFFAQPQMECPNFQADRCNWNRSSAPPPPGMQPDPGTHCHISPSNPWGESIPLYANYTWVAVAGGGACGSWKGRRMQAQRGAHCTLRVPSP